MLRWLFLSSLLLWPAAAVADEVTSVYTPFDLKKCKQVEKADEYVFEGTWRCKGYGGYDIWISGYDARNMAAFGTDGDNSCALRKTFNPFNTALSPVEWRLRSGQPFAAIERWSVSTGDDQPSVTWLVVSKLNARNSCPIHYVSGSFPNANEAARRAADTLAEKFDCHSGVPTFEAKGDGPPIDLMTCSDLAKE